MELLQVLLLTIGDHRPGFAITGGVLSLASLIMLSANLDSTNKDETRHGCLRWFKRLGTVAFINTALALFVPNQARLACLFEQVCK